MRRRQLRTGRQAGPALMVALLVCATLLAACTDKTPADTAPPTPTATAGTPLDGPTPAGAASAGTAPGGAAPTETGAPTETATPGGTTVPSAAAAPSATSPTAPTAPTAPPATTPQLRGPGPVRAVAAYGSVTFRRAVDVAAYPIGGFDLIVAEQGGQLMGLSAAGAEELMTCPAACMEPATRRACSRSPSTRRSRPTATSGPTTPTPASHAARWSHGSLPPRTARWTRGVSSSSWRLPSRTPTTTVARCASGRTACSTSALATAAAAATRRGTDRTWAHCWAQ